ncbi:unnamed protein product [Leptidea sinapis]|uniref:Phosphodiesterase n=1 Tax=Leptidea sinapis TaxID=189913 RepID=A0A5E4PMN2_9NEOP|nr:unnamed protein product [Leptidea sinapis]
MADNNEEKQEKKSIPLNHVVDNDSNKLPAVVQSQSLIPSTSTSKSMHHLPPINAEYTEKSVTDYLDRNRQFLEEYLIKSISTDELERWLGKKYTQTHPMRLESFFRKKLQSTIINSSPSHKDIFMDLIQKLQGIMDEYSLIREIACIVVLTERAFPMDNTLLDNFSKLSTVWRYSYDHSKLFEVRQTERNDHVIFVPIFNAAGKTIYIIQMLHFKPHFNSKDEESCSNLILWGSLTLHLYNLRDRSMANFLLDVVKAIFEEMISLDQVINKILEFVQRIVNADRASLFLVDTINNQLVSTVFDLKLVPCQGGEPQKEIRMPINRGIAGYVAQSGETMNITDAYSDSRFNREVDEMTGYETNSILCMPVKVQGEVIGVVQMVNKRDKKCFDREDEEEFEIFSTFFGLALHHARLYDKIMRKEQKYKIALEILCYHNTCKKHEVDELINYNNNMDVRLDDFYLDPYKFDDLQKCKSVIAMFDDLFAISNFDVETISKFVLTVKRNYRSVPYHNFDHGWSVAHAMYVIIKNDNCKRFDYKMRLALFVACLCHDLDHRGYTNKYMNETASPLAAMYSTSTLEHHHFNITVIILQQEGHNIFSHLSSEEYKEILGHVKHCILATDLAVFFPNLKSINELCGQEATSPKIDWTSQIHIDLAMAISMTAADLSASAKPWEIQIKTVKVIFEEFYEQGDKEKAAGKTPIPMMDRSKPEEQPSSQVGFLSQICVPCYNVLLKILPNTKPMYEMALRNLKNWKLQAKHVKKASEICNSEPLAATSETDLDNRELTCDKNVAETVDDTIITPHLVNDEICALPDNKIRKTLQSLKAESESWDEDKCDKLSSKATAILKDIHTDDFSGDEDGLVIAKK